MFFLKNKLYFGCFAVIKHLNWLFFNFIYFLKFPLSLLSDFFEDFCFLEK